MSEQETASEPPDLQARWRERIAALERSVATALACRESAIASATRAEHDRTIADLRDQILHVRLSGPLACSDDEETSEKALRQGAIMMRGRR